jgi:hypothetical protein
MERYEGMAGSNGKPFALQHCYKILVSMDVTKRGSMDVIRRARQGGAGGGDQASGSASGGVSLLIFESTSPCYLIVSNMHGF